MTIVLDLCGGTGSWSKPYKDAGYDVRIITLPEYDVRAYEPPNDVYGILAAPPCTEFSIAKAKWERNEEAGFEVVNACLRIIEKCRPKFWALENPSGWLSKYLGKSQYHFQPWWFGDPWTKQTHLWGMFNAPVRRYYSWIDVPKIPQLYVRPNRQKPSIAFCNKSAAQYIRVFDNYSFVSDAEFRAVTPPSFARAFFEVNR